MNEIFFQDCIFVDLNPANMNPPMPRVLQKDITFNVYILTETFTYFMILPLVLCPDYLL